MDKNSIRIKLPENVKFIISELEKAGYEAYAVGGCVRDSILGREAADWDITTSALPEDIKTVFKRTVDTGIEHGTVTVLVDEAEKKPIHKKIYDSFLMEIRAGIMEKRGSHFADEESTDDDSQVKQGAYEVTTYRIDGRYIDGRHPESVSFTSSLAEDLARRDFTVNAMAWNDRTGLVDLYGGLEDLENRLIRCVGAADERFDEDALRLLRAVRFSAQLGFDIEPGTAEAVSRHCDKLGLVSVERVYQEFSKLVCSAHMEKLELAKRFGLLPYMGSGAGKIDIENIRQLGQSHMEAHHRYDITKSTALKHRYIRYGFACQGMSSEEVREFLHSLKADNDTVKGAALLAERTLEPLPGDRYELKKAMSRTPREYFEDIIEMKLSSVHTDLYRTACADEDIMTVVRQYNDFTKRGEPVYLKDLVVKGDDLIKAGVPEGPEVGRMLEEMMDEVRRHPLNNSLLYLISQYLGRRK